MFRLPFSFIFTGMIGFILFHLLSLGSLAGWIGDYPRSPDGWFRVHLLVLGWATMIAMGAVYQLISVVLQSKIYSERLGFVHYGFFLVGLIGLLFGFRTGQPEWIGGFAVITLIGILLFVWNLLRTLFQAGQWNPVTTGVLCSLIYLTMTGFLGLAMGLNFAFGGLGEWHERLFAAHIWLGTIGWFGLLITGLSFKLMPMFYLSHGYPTRMQYAVLWLWNAGAAVGAVSFLCGRGSLGAEAGILLITLAALIYFVHLLQIRKARHKKKPGAGIHWAMISAGWLALLGILICIGNLLFPGFLFQEKWIVLLGWAYLWGWVAMSILGYLSKIAPFLWWTHKYGSQVGKKSVPTMAVLMNERWANIGLALIAASLIGLMLGIGCGQMWLIRIGGCGLSLFSLAYMSLIVRVFAR
jgi:hypothetical protein